MSYGGDGSEVYGDYSMKGDTEGDTCEMSLVRCIMGMEDGADKGLCGESMCFRSDVNKDAELYAEQDIG